MKHLIISLLSAIVLVLACSSDVTGPGEGTPPDTTTYEVLYRVSTSDELPHDMHVGYLEGGEWVSVRDTVAIWEHSFTEAQSGDSLHMAFGSRDQYEWLYGAIYIDGEWAASGGPPSGSGACSYVIP